MYDPAQPRSRVFLPAILSGLLLYCAFFPLNLGFLAWIALVPFLSLVRANARPRRIYFAAFVGGLFLYVPAIQWIRVAHPAMYGAWIFLAVVCSIFLTMTLALIRKLDRMGLPLVLSAPFAFISIEYLRSHFPTGYTWMEMFGARHPIGFGWYMVGHTQHDFTYLIQIADITGAYGLTFLVVFVNAALWRVSQKSAAMQSWLKFVRPDPTPTWKTSAAAFALIALAIVYGAITVGSSSESRPGPTVALIQGNIPQDVKNLRGNEMEDHFKSLANEAVTPIDGKRPDLVVWPETSMVHGWWQIASEADLAKAKSWSGLGPRETLFLRERNYSVGYYRERSQDWPVPTLYGLSSFQWEPDGSSWRYNSALFVDAKGKYLDRYDKIHLVPLGEYVPFEQTFPFLKSFTPYDTGDGNNCKPGSRWTRFALPVGDQTYRFACLICYEDTDASLARSYVRPGEENVDFFVNISNDGWFDGTEEHEQHLAICRFRCIETRRSMVRAVNMGISAIIDYNGRIVQLPGDSWANSRKVSGIVRGPVPLQNSEPRTTLYARFGDWLPLVAWGIIIVSIVLGFVRRKPRVVTA